MESGLISTAVITIGDETQQTVNARDLWAFLESKRDFSTWFIQRVEDCGFIEGRDFCSPVLGSKEKRGGHNRKEYAITLDMAKHLAMMERNERGGQARQYFIEVEKQFRNTKQELTSRDIQLITQAIIPVVAERERLKAQLAVAKHFLPQGAPGDINKNGEAKTRFRRGYYTAGHGRSITALIERTEQPGLFDEVILQEIRPNSDGRK